jgi:hypothetical protein
LEQATEGSIRKSELFFLLLNRCRLPFLPSSGYCPVPPSLARCRGELRLCRWYSSQPVEKRIRVKYYTRRYSSVGTKIKSSVFTAVSGLSQPSGAEKQSPSVYPYRCTSRFTIPAIKGNSTPAPGQRRAYAARKARFPACKAEVAAGQFAGLCDIPHCW